MPTPLPPPVHGVPTLRRVAEYNPHQQGDAEVIAGFIARKPLLARLIAELDRLTPTSRAQQHLVLGQRGLGKTTLLLRLAAELRLPSFASRFLPLTFAEEQYNVDRLSKFWLNCLDALADALQKRGDRQRLETVDATVDRCEREAQRFSQKDDPPFARRCLDELLGLAGQERLVLLLDNVQLMFERLSEQEQHVLREVLMRPGGPVLIAAAPNPVLATESYTAPFYDQLQQHWLAPLTADEMVAVMRELARAHGRDDVAARVVGQPARLKTLHLLTGGNPRAMVLLFHLYAEGLSSTVYGDLAGVLDRVTPLYKARFEEFPPQMQVVAAAIAELWDPCTARQLADHTSLGMNQVSAQLDRLERLGFIERVAWDEPELGWQIGERLFNVWYLMRLASRRRRRGVEFLTRFLETFFEPGDRERFVRDQRLRGQRSSDQILVALSVAETIADSPLRDDLRRQVDLSALELRAQADRERLHGLLGLDELPNETLQFHELRQGLSRLANQQAMTPPEELVRDWLGNWAFWRQGELSRLAQRDRFEEEDWEALRQAAASGRAALVDRFGQAAVEWLEARLAGGQIRALDNVEDWTRTILLAEPECVDAIRLIWLTWPRHQFPSLPPAAIDVFARQLGPKAETGSADDWFNWGLEMAGRLLFEQSEAAQRRALDLKPDRSWPWNSLGVALIHLGRESEAEAAFRRAITCDPVNAPAWSNLGGVLLSDPQRHVEASQALERSIACDSGFWPPWNGLGNLHADVTGNTHEAERCYLAALELEPESLLTRLNLAFLQRDLLLQFDVARETLAKVPAPADNSEHATWLLHEALFAAYSNDWDRLSEQLGLALARIPHGFPPLFFDDWMRASAVLVHLGFGARLLEWLTARGDCQRFRPWHEALRATELHWPEWLLRIAPEVRLPAEKIHAEIARRLARLPAASSRRPPPQPRHARRRRRG